MLAKFKFLTSKAFLFFASLILIWLAISVARVTYHRYQFNREINRLKSEIERTEKRNQELASLIEFFKTENFLEQEAREKLNLKKGGESVVVVPQAADIIVSTSSQNEDIKMETDEEETKKEESHLIQWWKYLFRE